MLSFERVGEGPTSYYLWGGLGESRIKKLVSVQRASGDSQSYCLSGIGEVDSNSYYPLVGSGETQEVIIL